MKKLTRKQASSMSKDELYDIYLDTFKQLKILDDKLDSRNIDNVKLITQVSELKIKLEEVQELKNERGAGRKQKLNDTDIENIRMYREQGKTIKEIATIYSCSVGLIHKLINEKNR